MNNTVNTQNTICEREHIFTCMESSLQRLHCKIHFLIEEVTFSQVHCCSEHIKRKQTWKVGTSLSPASSIDVFHNVIFVQANYIRNL